MSAHHKKASRWTLVDQSFLSLFITFFLVQLTNRGSGIIDGLFVSNFLDTDSIASVGIAKTIFSITGIISGLFTVGTQSKCSHELGKGFPTAFRPFRHSCRRGSAGLTAYPQATAFSRRCPCSSGAFQGSAPQTASRELRAEV